MGRPKIIGPIKSETICARVKPDEKTLIVLMYGSIQKFVDIMVLKTIKKAGGK